MANVVLFSTEELVKCMEIVDIHEDVDSIDELNKLHGYHFSGFFSEFDYITDQFEGGNFARVRENALRDLKKRVGRYVYDERIENYEYNVLCMVYGAVYRPVGDFFSFFDVINSIF